jgi:hypothetical protein
MSQYDIFWSPEGRRIATVEAKDERAAVGNLAYYDSSAGLIPCRVLTITGEPGMANTGQRVTVKLTANRRRVCGVWIYKRNEVIESNALHVIPRGSVCVRCGQYRIRGYSVDVQS